MKSFQTPELMQLFPTFVWKGDLARQESEPLNRDIVAALAGLGAPLEGLRPGENWQSDHGLHERAAFRPLLEWVEAAAANSPLGAVCHAFGSAFPMSGTNLAIVVALQSGVPADPDLLARDLAPDPEDAEALAALREEINATLALYLAAWRALGVV